MSGATTQRAGLLAITLFAGLAGLQCGESSSPALPASTTLQRGDRASCALVEANAQALIDEFATCSPGDSCEVFPIGEARTEAGPGPCIVPFLCSVAVRADANTSTLLTRAQTIVAGRADGCACATPNCAIADTLEGFCDPAIGRCALRKSPPAPRDDHRSLVRPGSGLP